MLYQIRTILGCIMILLGIIHIGFAFPISVFEEGHLWFIGSGVAIVLSGMFNVAAVVNCRQRWFAYLTLVVNLIMFTLFIVAIGPIKEPQVYVGCFLYLATAIILSIQMFHRGNEKDEYINHKRNGGDEFKEVLSETEAVPMLRIFDKKKAEEFYIDWLGFNLEWEHRFEENLPVYMEITKAGIKLHLTEHHGDCSPGGKVYIVCAGLAEYHKQLLAKNYSYNRPGLGKASWGSLEMTVIDPFGNQLLFTERKEDKA